jgi:hypothetical protein
MSYSVLGTYLGKTAPENPPVPLNSLFPEGSTDSNEDLAEEYDSFFNEEEEEAKNKKGRVVKFLKTKSWKALISVTDLFAEFDDFDITDDYGYLPQASDKTIKIEIAV